jgi:hypothetical protein
MCELFWKKSMKVARSFATVLVLLASPAAMAASRTETRYSFGLHDVYVSEEDSHTPGINATVLYRQTLSSGMNLGAVAEIFWDRDTDHLDPDHIPIWWRTHLWGEGPLVQLTDGLDVSWVADINTKANTVSSVEREIKALPGIELAYDSGSFDASLKGAAGWFFLEIDDDVPKERGYARGDFRYSTFAGSLAGHVGVSLGDSVQLSGGAQNWFDSDGWLENQYVVELRYRLDKSPQGPEIVVDYEYTEYNLDPYTPSRPEGDAIPILPWDHDQYVKIAYEKHW